MTTVRFPYNPTHLLCTQQFRTFSTNILIWIESKRECIINDGVIQRSCRDQVPKSSNGEGKNQGFHGPKHICTVRIVHILAWSRMHMSPERHAMAGNHARLTTAAFSYTASKAMLGNPAGFWNPGNFYLWNSESRKKIPEESRILGFGIRNPTDDWNAESKSHWQKIRNPVPEVRNLCLGTVLDYLTRGDQQTRRYVLTRRHVCSVKLY